MKSEFAFQVATEHCSVVRPKKLTGGTAKRHYAVCINYPHLASGDGVKLYILVRTVIGRHSD
jgi:hypothetical protein